MGQKTIKELPKIMQESMTVGQEWGTEIATKILGDLEKTDRFQPPPPMLKKNK